LSLPNPKFEQRKEWPRRNDLITGGDAVSGQISVVAFALGQALLRLRRWCIALSGTLDFLK